MPRQQLAIDARFVVEALGVSGRHQLDQVVIALVCFREQDQVIGGLAGIAALGQPAARRHVDFATQDRLEPTRPRMVVEDHRRKHVAVLGDANRRHLQRGRLIEQLVDPARAVEQ